MAKPQLIKTNETAGRTNGVDYTIQGELLPSLTLNLDGSREVFFEHHIILWKDASMEVGIRKLKGAFKRVFAGMPIFLTEARSQGSIGLSRDYPGHILAVHIQPGEQIFVREHQYLAATGNVDYTFQRAGGVSSMLFGSQGFFIDRFSADNEEAVVWIHGNGNLFEVELATGETIDLEPGSWVYYSGSVSYSQKVYGLKTGILGGGGNIVFNRFVGPGKVVLQSGYYEIFGTGASSGTAKGGLSGGLIGGALDLLS